MAEQYSDEKPLDFNNIVNDSYYNDDAMLYNILKDNSSQIKKNAM